MSSSDFVDPPPSSVNVDPGGPPDWDSAFSDSRPLKIDTLLSDFAKFLKSAPSRGAPSDGGRPQDEGAPAGLRSEVTPLPRPEDRPVPDRIPPVKAGQPIANDELGGSPESDSAFSHSPPLKIETLLSDFVKFLKSAPSRGAASDGDVAPDEVAPADMRTEERPVSPPLDTPTPKKTAPAKAEESSAVKIAAPPAVSDAGAEAMQGAMASPGVLAAIGLGMLAAAGGGGGGGNSNGGGTPTPSPDVTPPPAPVLDAVSTDNRVNASEKAAGVVVSGTAEPGAIVTVSWAGLSKAASAAANGQWSIRFETLEVPTDGATTLRAVARDAAGNASAEAAVNVLVDSVGVNVTSLAANAASRTVTLTWDDTLDAANPPAAAAFSVTVGGVPNPVSTVSVSGNLVTLGLANAFSPGAVTVAYADPVGDAANAVQDAAGNDAASFSSGVAADGYVSGAVVYVDVDDNGRVDPARDFRVGNTNSSGQFFLPATAPRGSLIAVGGVNIDTGFPNTVPLRAPEGATVINPLTTLVQALVSGASSTLGPEAAQRAVSERFGLVLPPGQSLLGYDPIAVNDAATQKIAAQIATLAALASGGDAALANTVLVNLAASLTVGSGRVDLATPDGRAPALAGVSLTSGQLTLIAEATSALDGAGSLDEISRLQGRYLDTTAPAAPQLQAESLTRDSTPTIRLTFDTRATDGTAAVAGDRLQVLRGDSVLLTHELSTAQIAAGRVDLDLPLLSDGTHSLSARLMDSASLQSPLSNSVTLRVDTRAPEAPTLLAVTGDDVINAAERPVTVSGSAEAGSTVRIVLGAGLERAVTAVTGDRWEYVLQAAEIDSMGQGSKAIAITATDAAGNVSTTNTRLVVIDTVASAAPVIGSVATDDIINANEASSGAGVVVSGTAEGVRVDLTVGQALSRLLSPDAQGRWSAVLTTAELAAMSQGAINLRATVTDAAGNVSAAGERVIVLDTAAPVLSGLVLVGGATGRDATPDLRFSAEREANILVDWGAGGGFVAATVASGAEQVLTAPVYAADGAYTIRLRAADRAGNSSEQTAVFRLDTVAPASAMVNVVAGDNILSHEERAAGVAITGTAEAEGAVAVQFGLVTKTATATNGAWRVDFAPGELPAPGTATLSVTVTDAAGNTSIASTRSIRVDPEVLINLTLDSVGGDNRLNAEEINSGVILRGGAEGAARVDVVWGGMTRQAVFAAGAWSLDYLPGEIPPDGTADVVVYATDANGGRISLVRPVLIDSDAPPAPVVLQHSAGAAISEAERAEGVTFTGTAQADTTVTLSLAGVNKTVGVSGGAWSARFSASELPGDGSWTLTAQARDVAGNAGPFASQSVVVDTLAPDLPTINIVAGDNFITGQEAGAGVAVSGSAEEGAQVAVTFGATTRSVTAGLSGWAVTFLRAELPADGARTVTAIATDAAGNESGRASRAVNLDTTPPPAPTLNAVSTDDRVNAAERGAGVLLSGAASGVSLVLVTVGALESTAQVEAGGAWSLRLAAGDLPANGSVTVQVASADEVGNSASASRTLLVDSLAPELADAVLEAGTAGRITLSLNEAAQFDAGAVSPVFLRNGASALAVTSHTVSGVDVSFLLSGTIGAGDHLEVRLPAGNGLKDVAGNSVGQSVLVVGSQQADTLDYSARADLSSGVVVLAGGGDDQIKGSAAADYIEVGAGVDRIFGSGGGDEYRVDQGDGAAVAFAPNAGSGGSPAGIFNLLAGADVFSQLFGGDIIELYSAAGLPGLARQSLSAQGTVGDQQFALTRGNWNPAGTGQFVTDTAGVDTLVVLDGNTQPGLVSQTAFVIAGIDPARINVQTNQLVIV